MARIKRPRRCARPISDDGGAADRLSALPDDLLRLILRRLDTRTALSTAVLARRWARLSREVPALELRVGDVLPRRYHRGLALRRATRRATTPGRDCTAGFAVQELDALLVRCERRAMRAFADGVAGLLDAAEGVGDGGDRRRAKGLRLEFFPTEESGCVDRLIPTAVADWGVEDLEIVARPPHLDDRNDDDDGPAYAFPHHLLDDELHRSRLRSLTLANCTVPPLYRYGALAELVLRDMPASTPAATYQRLFTARSPLETLRLVSCGCAGEAKWLVVSAPCSRLRELVVDGCSFLAVELLTLPTLERLACLTNSVELRFGAGVPRLEHVNLSFSRRSAWYHDELSCFLEDAPATVASLAVRFTGPERWIFPLPLATKLTGLRKLLVADVPSSWDVTWTRALLMAAPALEVMHVHVAAPSEPDETPGREIRWPAFKFRHRRLREVAVAGFERTWRQIFFVRYLARVCKALQRVLLLKDWCVREVGLWDWELVQRQECPWSEEDKMVVRKQIKYGKYWCRPQLQVIVG